jgi:hypothetical protein
MTSERFRKLWVVRTRPGEAERLLPGQGVVSRPIEEADRIAQVPVSLDAARLIAVKDAIAALDVVRPERVPDRRAVGAARKPRIFLLQRVGDSIGR